MNQAPLRYYVFTPFNHPPIATFRHFVCDACGEVGAKTLAKFKSKEDAEIFSALKNAKAQLVERPYESELTPEGDTG